MRFECYHNWHELPADSDPLFESSSQSSLFFSRTWFETLFETVALEKDQSLLLACVVDDDTLMALLPLVHSDQQHYRSYTHRYSALFSPVWLEQDQASILTCLVEGLRALSVRSIQLKPVDANGSDMVNFRKVMESCGFSCQPHFSFYNWVHRTGGQSFEEYLATRPSKLRNTIARKKRKLEREHDSKIQMYMGDAVQNALSDYHAAYSSSWKASEQYGHLLDALAVNLSQPDWTRLAVLYIDGEPAAAQLWFVVHAKASIFRLAYDERWKQYSTGSILTAWLMQYVIDIDKVEEVDFLTGNEAYKQDWMTERRERSVMAFVKTEKKHNRFDAMLHKLRGVLDNSST